MPRQALAGLQAAGLIEGGWIVTLGLGRNRSEIDLLHCGCLLKLCATGNCADAAARSSAALPPRITGNLSAGLPSAKHSGLNGTTIQSGSGGLRSGDPLVGERLRRNACSA